MARCAFLGTLERRGADLRAGSARALEEANVPSGPMGEGGGLRPGAADLARSSAPGDPDQYPGVLDRARTGATILERRGAGAAGRGDRPPARQDDVARHGIGSLTIARNRTAAKRRRRAPPF